MPTYFFNLKNAEGTILDPVGTDLPDEHAAWEHARIVANEIMRHREARTRFWRLQVADGNRDACFDLLFANIDDSIRHLSPELRGSVENLCAKSASLCETIHAVKLTLLQMKGTIARSERAPYIAAINGVRIP